MRYPTSYVLVSDMDDYLMPSQTALINVNSSGPSGDGLKGTLAGAAATSLNCGPGETFSSNSHNSPFTASTHTLLAPGYLSSGGRGLGWSRGMGERVWQDIVQCPGHQSQSHGEGLTPEGTLTPAEIVGQWDFACPSTKMSCSCTKYASFSLFFFYECFCIFT